MGHSYEYDFDDPLVYKNEMGVYKTERQLSFVQRWISHSRMNIVDIGGGSGRLAIPLSVMGHTVTVVDPSAEASELLKSRANGAVTAVQADLMSYEPRQVFDAAIVVDSLKYMTQLPIPQLFGKVNSMVKRGGVVVISEINKRSWRNKLSEVSGRRRDDSYNLAGTSEYVDALTSAGFQMSAVEGYVWMPFTFNSNSSLIKAFARAERMLRLEKWVAQSPWVLIAAQKVREVDPSLTANSESK